MIGATACDVGRRDRRGQRGGVLHGQGRRRAEAAADTGGGRSCCPGETISRLVPSELIWALHLPAAPWPRPTVSTTAAMPIRMPSMVSAGAQPVRCGPRPSRSGRSPPGHADDPRRAVRQSDDARTSGRRGPGRSAWRARATSISWVISTIVRPCVVQLVEQGQDVGGGDRVEVAGRLVGQDQRRVGDQRPGDGDPLLLAAGQLARPVARPGRPGRPGRARPAPVALRSSRSHAGVDQRQLDVAPGRQRGAAG